MNRILLAVYGLLSKSIKYLEGSRNIRQIVKNEDSEFCAILDNRSAYLLFIHIVIVIQWLESTHTGDRTR